MKRAPCCLMPSNFKWPSHEVILPCLEKFFRRIGVKVIAVDFDDARQCAETARFLSASASLVIFPLGFAGHLDFLELLRKTPRFRARCVYMLGANFAYGGLRLLARRNLFKAHDIFVTNSTAEYELAKFALKKHDAIRLIPLPVFPNRNGLTAMERLKIRSNMGVEPGEKFLVYAGRLSAAKNVHSLLEVFKQVLRKIPDSKLALVGKSDQLGLLPFGRPSPVNYIEFLRDRTRALEIGGRVIFRGQVNHDETRKILAAADLALTATIHTEDFGYAVAESVIAGTPTLATRWGGCRDFIDSGAAEGIPVTVTANGNFIDYDGAADTAVKMLALSDDKAKRKSIRDSAISLLHIRRLERLWRETIFEAESGTWSDEPVEFSPRFIDFYLESLAEARDGRGSAFFRTPEHALYRDICRIYVGMPSAGRAANYYLNPTYSLDTGTFDDPTVFKDKPPLNGKEKKSLRRILRTNFARLDGFERKLLSKLENSGIVLRG